ncbi:unnamed protein product [Clonostachys solani]|uniref:FAD-binding domain-containing protein n=1 Tax=Clonostachys solani TaxID=160281 RepID=A0A9N9Z9T7_9HYPO|nr:unnamed protein product [Clonostachys solani]
MIPSTRQSIDIIGASVGGLTFGLTLLKYGIRPRFFEFRPADYDFGGAVSLTPNGLRALDSLDAYSRIKAQGYCFQEMTFLTVPELEMTAKFYFGHKDVYGYDGLRITRKVLIQELRDMVKEAGCEIHYEKKFIRVVKEDDDGVEYEFADGTRETCALLVGSDGIHSKVRSYIFPDLDPHYTGFVGLTYSFPRANVHLEEGFPLPASLRDKSGSNFIITPQAEGGKEIFIGRQYKYEQKDHTKSGWEVLTADKQAIVDILQRDTDAWTPLVQTLQAQVVSPEAEFLNVWPFYTMKGMDRWHSPTGRVLVIGDAAHAIPPPAGQGANQALEDSYSLGMLLASLDDKVKLLDMLRTWETYRMKRMDDALLLTTRLMTLRMKEEERENMPEEVRSTTWKLDWTNAGKEQLDWLFSVDIDRDVEDLIKTLNA